MCAWGRACRRQLLGWCRPAGLPTASRRAGRGAGSGQPRLLLEGRGEGRQLKQLARCMPIS